MEYRFKIGDQVTVSDDARSDGDRRGKVPTRLWVVTADDTNRAGGWGRDLEPAYRLERPGGIGESRYVRYACQSAMTLAPATLGQTGDLADGEEEAETASAAT